MKAITPRTIDLGRRQLMVFEAQPGEHLRVLQGTTWLTQEGEPDDAMLSPGADLALHAGRTLVEALEPTRVQIVSSGGPAMPAPVRALVRAARRWLTRLQLGPIEPEPAR